MRIEREGERVKEREIRNVWLNCSNMAAKMGSSAAKSGKATEKNRERRPG